MRRISLVALLIFLGICVIFGGSKLCLAQERSLGSFKVINHQDDGKIWVFFLQKDKGKVWPFSIAPCVNKGVFKTLIEAQFLEEEVLIKGEFLEGGKKARFKHFTGTVSPEKVDQWPIAKMLSERRIKEICPE